MFCNVLAQSRWSLQELGVLNILQYSHFASPPPLANIRIILLIILINHYCDHHYHPNHHSDHDHHCYYHCHYVFFYCYWCRYIIITTTIINIITLIIIIITISLATSHHKWHSRKALRLPQNQLIAPHRRTPQHEGPRRQWHRYPILKDDKSRSRIPWTVGSPACNLQSAFWLSLQHDPLLLLLLYGATLGNFPDINSTSSCLLFKCFPGV